MRRGVALWQVFTLCVLLNISSLVACPFLQPENSGDSHACCRKLEPSKNKAAGPKCPISPTIDTCPLNFTESKLGTLKGKVDLLYPPAPAAGPVQPELRFALSAQTPRSNVADTSDTFLKIRVLRI
jgi:hypothetical protein